jgi:Concanavalin A-like lectin/glucanases superfamily/Secretion system C-terminal sorting domain
MTITFPTIIKAFIVAFALIVNTLSAQTILRVNANSPCTSGCDGSTWALAYPNLQTALTAFSSGEIWVAAGTYKPAGVGGNRSTSFDLKSNMAIYGGFNGSENSRSARDYAANLTVLSGDLNGNDVGMALNAENSYHVLTAYVKTGVVVDGFTIKEGNANVSGTNYGGGFYAQQCEATIQHCIFDTNNASDGGALCWIIPSYDASPTSNLTLTDCIFRNNRGIYGGAIALVLEKGTTTSRIENCLFQYNEGTGASVGGCIFTQLGAAAVGTLNSTIKGCTFKNNAASYGGVMLFGQNTGSLITNNVVNCKIMNNSGVFGGAMNNLVGQQTFKNCLFSKNTAAYGEAILTPEAAQFINCTFSGNAGQGSTCFRSATTATTLTNCILWNQTDPIDNASAVVNYCNVQGGWATGTGNTSVDPLFLDATNDNYTLKCTSPCRNVGNNAANAEATDLVGATRIQETTIDLGAYETDGVTLGVSIADAAFAAAIRSDCPTCINGSNVLLCAALTRTSLTISGQNISNLTGIEQFSSLMTLNASNNNLTILPTLPSSLKTLNASNNNLTTLLTLPNGLTNLNVSNNSLTSLPTTLPSSLTVLNVSNNNLTSLPATLPSNLTELQLQNNTVTCLPTLPNSLATLNFDAADIPCIPNKPTALTASVIVCAAITMHPSVSTTVCDGGNANLVVKANSISPMTVKWQRKGASDADYSDVLAAATYTSNTNTTYTFTPTSADNNAFYRAVFTPVCSGVTATATQLTVMNGPVAPATTTDNNSLSFDGANDCVQIVNCSGAAFPFTDAITIEYWFKGSSMQSAVRFQPDADTYIVSGWSNKHIISTSSGTSGVGVGTGATDGNWHHVAMTWQKGVTNGFIPYLDGVRGTRRTATNVNLPTMNSGLYLGSNNGTSEFMNGTIDEVRIWNVARSQADIQANMCSLTLPQTGLVMYYRFNHGVANGANSVNTLRNSVQSDAFVGVLNNFNLSGASSNFSSSIPSSCPAVVLPAELLDFKGKNILPNAQNTDLSRDYREWGNLLTWQTALEQNTLSFDIERSMDGQVFEKVGEVKAKGSYSTYEFIDTKTLANFQTSTTLGTLKTTYYRLKINDLDGKIAFSKIISLENGKILRGVKIYPNPVSDVLTIENIDEQGVEIVNILGQVILSEKATTRTTFNIQHLESGVYFVKTGGQTVRFIKK